MQQKEWKPGCIVCDDVDEYYEPIERTERKFAARLALELKLIMHRAKLDVKKLKVSPAIEPKRRRIASE